MPAIPAAYVAWAALAATVAAGTYSAVQSHQQGIQQKRIFEYNAKVQDEEARARQRDAAAAANAQRAQNEAIKARQRSLYAKSGVVDAGSPLLVMANQAAVLEMGALETERTGDIEAGRLRQDAAMSRVRGSIAKSAGKSQAIGTLLQTAASAASQYSSGKANGTF